MWSGTARCGRLTIVSSKLSEAKAALRENERKIGERSNGQL